jgi:hypothetical protein
LTLVPMAAAVCVGGRVRLRRACVRVCSACCGWGGAPATVPLPSEVRNWARESALVQRLLRVGNGASAVVTAVGPVGSGVITGEQDHSEPKLKYAWR